MRDVPLYILVILVGILGALMLIDLSGSTRTLAFALGASVPVAGVILGAAAIGRRRRS